MTAFMDCILFLMIIMMAISVTAVTNLPQDVGDDDPERFLSLMARAEVRLSDLTDIEDDSLVFMTDVIAYSVSHECSVNDYLKDMLDASFGEHRYLLEYEYGGISKIIGEDAGYFRYQSSTELPVSIGGKLSLVLGTI